MKRHENETGSYFDYLRKYQHKNEQEELNDLGGADKLAKMLRSDVTQGLPQGDNLEERATEFGHNWVRNNI